MNKFVINNVFELSYPDSFRLMEEDDFVKFHGGSLANEFGIINDETETIINIFYKKVKKLSYAITSTSNALKGSEFASKNRIENYENLGYFKRNFSGVTGDELKYSYTKDGNKYSGRMIVLKYDGFFYTICTYRHLDNIEDDVVIDEIMESITK